MSKERFELLCATSNELGEKNDCVLKALSLTMNIPYVDMREYFKDKRTKRGGVYPSVWQKAIKDFGWTYEFLPLYGKTPRTFERNFKYIMRLKNQKEHKPILFWFKSHLAAFVNGECADWTQGRCHRIRHVLELTKVEG